MNETIELLRLFIIEYKSYEYIIIFFGALLGGEIALFALGFLSSQGFLSIYPVIFLSFFGALIPNILWFLIGKTKTTSNILLHRYTSPTVSVLTESIEKMSRGNHFIAIIIIKFVVGTPFILTTYVHKTNIGFKKFIYYQMGAIALSMLVIMPLGFISGLGFIYLIQIFDNLYAALGFLLLLLITIMILKSLIQNSLTKNINL